MLSLTHFRFGQDRDPKAMAWSAPIDQPLDGMVPFEAFRLRFQVSNRDTQPVTWEPRLEWSTSPDRGFQQLKVGDDQGVPFYIRAVASVVNGQEIAETNLSLGKGEGKPERGRVYDEQSKAPGQALGAESYTEVEFSLRATLSASWRTTYYFRLTNGGSLLSGQVATLTMGGEPPPELSPGQRQGLLVGPAKASVARHGSPDFGALFASAGASAGAASQPAPPQAPLAAIGPSPHTSYDPASDSCAGCHRTHTSNGRTLAAQSGAQSNTCFACHDGTGANSNVKANYTDTSVPANNATTSSFYSHPATAAGSGHTKASLEEFKAVLNRHTECADCHNPHDATSALATQTASGWSASGAIRGTTGVGVTNGAARTAPTNTFLQSASYEYQVCLKCHSSYTTLLSYTKQSYKMQDKGLELNPANASFHPVEAPGKNTTTAMNNQLAGTSPSKLWTFTTGSTIRCVNCHGDYRKTAPIPAAGARLAPHSSPYRGILMNNYRDRDLKPYSSTNNYAAADFALCYQCHGEAAFTGTSSTNTNFNFHNFHLRGINDYRQTGSLDVDTAGAGQGNAICAECHYELHSTAAAPYSTNQGYQRLVSFSPNVTGTGGGQPIWNQAGRSCTLTCHGYNHDVKTY